MASGDEDLRLGRGLSGEDDRVTNFDFLGIGTRKNAGQWSRRWMQSKAKSGKSTSDLVSHTSWGWHGISREGLLSFSQVGQH